MADIKDQKTDREFKLTSASVKNRTTVSVVLFIILIGGMLAYNNMPKESFPEVNAPEIYVGTPYPGNAPFDIERLITRPIEKEINTISDVDEINSTSVQGYSTIQVKFNFNVSPQEALRKVKDEVDKAKADKDFPKDLPTEPDIFELNFSEMVPIMNINLSGEFSQDELKKYAEYLEEEIENLQEITGADIRGYTEKEVSVSLDIHAMNARQVSFNDVAQAISNENTTISGGDVTNDNFRRSIRVVGEFENPEDLGKVVVKHENNNIVYLNDIGDVAFVQKERDSYARQYLRPVVMVDVKKRAGANLIEASNKINDILEKAKKEEFPETLEISVTGDQSDQTKTQVDELANSIIFGVILVTAVLFFFLGLRNALFVGIAIPLSMFMSFFILNIFGVTLNTIVLFALVLALGLLVDNGIVVVENIYRLMYEGHPPLKAAKIGAGEVAWPIIASTGTTLAAFIPLGFWPGLIGNFMQYLPITLIIVLTSSLFVALVINPVLTSVFMKVREDDSPAPLKKTLIYLGLIGAGLALDLVGDTSPVVEIGAATAISVILLLMLKDFVLISSDTPKKRALLPGFGLVGLALIYFVLNQNVSANFIGITGTFILLNSYVLFPGSIYFQNRLIPAMENFYDRFISYVLSGIKPYVFLVGTLFLLLFSVGLIMTFTPKVLFFPENEPQYLNIYIENPIGTDIEYTNEMAREIEERVLDVIDKYEAEDPETGEKKNFLVESVIGQVGQGTSDPAQGQQLGNTPHKARITVSFVKFQDRRGVKTGDVQTEIRNAIRDYPGTKITVDKNQAGPPQGLPINIEVQGDDYLKLMDEVVRMRAFIEEAGIEGIEELKTDVEPGKPELLINVDRRKARRLGLSTAQIGDALRTSVFGAEVSTYTEGEDDYEINMRLKQDMRNNIDVLMNQRITFRDPSTGRIVQVPISSVADVSKVTTLSAVKRKDMERVITLSSNVEEGYNPNDVVNQIRERLKNFDLHALMSYKFTGQQEEQAEEFDFLSTALGIAFFLIILIIVAQFNSISTPFIIGSSVLFSLIGVLLGLVFFRMDFIIIMTMIGIISLAGIVVNNAIVLIDYTILIEERIKRELGIDEDQYMPFKYVRKAIEEGGKVRLRPVLLTAITTIFGLIPLAIGLNIDFFSFFQTLDPKIYVGGDNVMFWGPIAWTIIFGLIFATFLTLVIVPIMLYLVAKIKYAVFKNKVAQPETEQQ